VAQPKPRCFWCGEDPLYVAYHDDEWGVPVHDDRLLFEQLILEGAQAGLSWITVLKKRDHYRKAFANFDARKVARFDAKKVDALMANPGVIRHRGKLESVALNARAFLAIQEEHGSFSKWLWAKVDNKPVIRRSRTHAPGDLTAGRADFQGTQAAWHEVRRTDDHPSLPPGRRRARRAPAGVLEGVGMKRTGGAAPFAAGRTQVGARFIVHSAKRWKRLAAGGWRLAKHTRLTPHETEV
jgi:DNA-3-methyladenine glycosylase I